MAWCYRSGGGFDLKWKSSKGSKSSKSSKNPSGPLRLMRVRDELLYCFVVRRAHLGQHTLLFFLYTSGLLWVRSSGPYREAILARVFDIPSTTHHDAGFHHRPCGDVYGNSGGSSFAKALVRMAIPRCRHCSQ